MPTYIYKNLNTGETFEVQQSIKDAPLSTDPHSGDPVKRIISAPAITFKGSGFYVNDSRPQNSKES